MVSWGGVKGIGNILEWVAQDAADSVSGIIEMCGGEGESRSSYCATDIALLLFQALTRSAVSENS